MVTQVLIDYNPETQIDTRKHDAWERTVNQYPLLSVGSDDGSCRLIAPQNLDLGELIKELKPIKVLSSS